MILEKKTTYGPYKITCDNHHHRPFFVRLYFTTTRRAMFDFCDAVQQLRRRRPMPKRYLAISIGIFHPAPIRSVSTIIIPIPNFRMSTVTHESTHAAINYLRYRFNRRSLPLHSRGPHADFWEEQLCIVTGQIARQITLRFYACQRRYGPRIFLSP